MSGSKNKKTMQTSISVELKSHFLRLYQIACADENFDILEMKLLYKFAEDRGVDTAQLNEILVNPVHRLGIPESQDKRIEYLYDFAVMIWVDKEITEDEYNTLKKYCKKFEFLDENIVEICDFLLDCAKKYLPTYKVLELINN